MKDTTPLFKLSAVCFAAAFVIIGCGTFKTGAPAGNKVEDTFFTTKTNYVPVVVPITTYSTQQVVQTVVQFLTNQVGVTQTVTNYATNLVTVPQQGTKTNLVENYYKDANGTAAAVATGGGMLGNFFGYGGLVTTALGGLFTIWGWLRSAKNMSTAANTAQVVEVIREFVKQLPNGAAYDAALVNFMTQHQAEAGVLDTVIQLLASRVSNGDAKVAAAGVIAALQQLGINPSGPGAVTNKV